MKRLAFAMSVLALFLFAFVTVPAYSSVDAGVKASATVCSCCPDGCLCCSGGACTCADAACKCCKDKKCKPEKCEKSCAHADAAHDGHRSHQ